MDTKQCPYCGEEILAAAKKCKHCGEWLEKLENDTTSTSEKIIVNHKPPKYKLLLQMSVFAIFVEISCMVKALFIGDVPWVLTIFSGFLMVYLLIGLRNHYMTKRADKPIPFLALICLTAGMSFLLFIIDIAADADEDVLILFSVLALMVLIPVAVFEFIVGFQLKEKLKEASSVGIAMIVYAAAGIFGLFIVLASGFDDEATPWITFIESGVAIYFFIVLTMFFGKEKANVEIENTNDEDEKSTE